jgi:GDP-L-fucose synthase
MAGNSIIILGHTGFVGKTVFEYLMSKDEEVYGLSLSTGCDLRSTEALLENLNALKPNIVINCAAQVGSLNYVSEFAADVINNNMKMITSIYEAVTHYNKNTIIYNPIANCSYPGNVEKLYSEENWLDGPIHSSVYSYGNSRRMLVAYGNCYAEQYGIRTKNLLVPNMYGPYDSTDPNKAHALNAMISKFVKAYFNNEEVISIWGTGNVIREWLFAKDFAKVVYSMIKNQESLQFDHDPINIGQNHGITISGLAEIINSYFDDNFILSFDTSKPDGAPKKVMSDKLFRQYFPDFKFEDFKSGVMETIDYYKSKYPY